MKLVPIPVDPNIQKKIEAIYDRAGKACGDKFQSHLRDYEPKIQI